MRNLIIPALHHSMLRTASLLTDIVDRNSASLFALHDAKALLASALRSSTACELIFLDGDMLMLAEASPDREALGEAMLMLMLECLLCVPTTAFLGEAFGGDALRGSTTTSSVSTAVRFIFRPSSRASFSPASIAPCSFLFRVFASCAGCCCCLQHPRKISQCTMPNYCNERGLIADVSPEMQICAVQHKAFQFNLTEESPINGQRRPCQQHLQAYTDGLSAS